MKASGPWEAQGGGAPPTPPPARLAEPRVPSRPLQCLLQKAVSPGPRLLAALSLPPGGDGPMPPMWETQVQSLGWEDPLEKGIATHSSILVWEIPWTEEPGGGILHGVAESDTTARPTQ